LALDSVRNYFCCQLLFNAHAHLTVAAEQIVEEIGTHTSFQDIIDNLHSELPSYTPSAPFISLYSITQHDQPNVYQSVIVLVNLLPVSALLVLHMQICLPCLHDYSLRGFLVIFDLAQILNLLWTSFKTQFVYFCYYLGNHVLIPHSSVFGRTPRDIREWTQPPEFEYAIY
jgi:hypothetical protein